MVEEEVVVGSDRTIVPEQRKAIVVALNGLLSSSTDEAIALELKEVLVVGAPGKRSGRRVAGHAGGGINRRGNEARVAELTDLQKIRHREGVLWCVEDTSGRANLVFEDGWRKKVDLREIAKDWLGA